MKIGVFLIICVLLCNSLFAVDFTVEISGVQPGQGKICLAVFDNEKDFPSGKNIACKSVKPANNKVTIKFSGIKAGKYAFAAFQDKNGNKKLDKNLFGIPTERYGFSGKKVFGGPSFKDALVAVKSKDQIIKIELK